MVNASTGIGDVNSDGYGETSGWLGKTLKYHGEGKYELRAHVGVGDIQSGREVALPYFSVGMCMYIDWIAMRPGPLKRFQTSCPALANNPVESLWNCVSICTVRSL